MAPTCLDSEHALAPWQPAPDDPWDRAKVAHLLRRAGFGGTAADRDRLLAVGPQRAVDTLLASAPGDLRSWGVTVLGHEVLDLDRELESQRAAWLHELVHTKTPLREKVALFWHDHFSVGTRRAHSRSHMLAHLDLLRRHALGPLRDLYRALLADPAMLVFLDNYCNGQPDGGVPRVNLNFGREVLELYGPGAGSDYTQDDVVAASACLSGWGMVSPITTNACVWRADWHVPGPKRVLGKIIDNADGRQDAYDLIDVVLSQPQTARRLVQKVWRWFVADEAPAALLDLLAARFAGDGFDVRALFERILRSRYFFGPGARHRLVRNPVELVVGVLLGLERPAVRSWRELGERVARMGWPLLEYVTPAGLAEGTWLSTQGVISRLQFVHDLVRAKDGPDTEPHAAGAPARAVAALLEHWFPGESLAQLRDAAEAAFAAARADGAAPAGATAAALRLLLGSPQYQRC